MFRNNVGVFLTNDGRRVRTGLCVGSSDLVGWTVVEVTPEMVGEKIALFTAVECKTPKGRVTKAQLNFTARVVEQGGIAVIARGDSEALDMVESAIENLRRGLR